MNRTRAIVAAFLSITLTACASVPRSYNPNKSKALNLAEAGGIDGLKDQKVSAQEYQHIQEQSALADIGWTAANVANPAPGFSSGFGLGLGIASLLFPKTPVARRFQLIAWMPADMAKSPEDAQVKMRDIVDEAFTKALQSLGWLDGRSTERADESSYLKVGALVTPPDQGCPPIDAVGQKCNPWAAIYKPASIENSPKALPGSPYPNYFFSADALSRSRIIFLRPESTKVETSAFYQAVSKYLPEWAYIYVPAAGAIGGWPTEYKTNEYDAKMPIIYQAGRAEMFVMPETSKAE